MPLRPLTRDRWNELIALEVEVFGPHEYLFSEECLGRLAGRHDAGITIAVEDDRLCGYLSFFPLTREGTRELIDQNKLGVSGMSADAICRTWEDSEALFFEVVAAAQDASKDLRRELMQEMARKVFDYPRDVYSCPVTEVGLKIMSRLKFTPLSEPGLDRIYVGRKASI